MAEDQIPTVVDDTINEGYATDIQNIMSQEIENKIKEDFLSPTDARTQVYKKYFTRVCLF